MRSVVGSGGIAIAAAAVFGAACVCLGVGAGVGVGVAGADPPPPPPPSPAAAPAPAGTGATTIDHDGTFAVGTDIQPGTYSSPGPLPNGTCYWKRISANNDIIDNALSTKPQVVGIDPTDKAFKTDGCQPWHQTDASPDAGLPPQVAGAQLPGLLAGMLPGLLPHPSS